MSRELADTVWARYIVNGIYLDVILSLSEQRILVRKLNKNCTSEVPEKMNYGEDN